MIIFHGPSVISIAIAAICLSACDTPASQPRKTSPLMSQAVPAYNTSATETPSPIQTSSVANAVGKTCEGVTFRIALMSRSSELIKKTSLSLIDDAGAPATITEPEEMSEYTAVGLGCAVAKANGKPYFVVQFGELPYGCRFCEWFYLYDADGMQLTRSNPPIVTDTSLPEGAQQSSNTQEYQLAIEKLQVTHPDMSYIQ